MEQRARPVLVSLRLARSGIARRLSVLLASVLLVAGLAPAAAAADPSAGYDATWTVTNPDLTARTDGGIAVGDDLALTYAAVDGTPVTACRIRLTAVGGSLMETPGDLVDGECRLKIRIPDFPDPRAREQHPPGDAGLDLCVWVQAIAFADGQTRSMRAEDNLQPGGRLCPNWYDGDSPRLDFWLDPNGTARAFESTPRVLSWNPADWGTGMSNLEFGKPWRVELPDWVVRCGPNLNGTWGTHLRPAMPPALPGGDSGCSAWEVQIPGVLPSTLPWSGDPGDWTGDLLSDWTDDPTRSGGWTHSALRVPLAPSDGVFTSNLPAIFPTDLATARFVAADVPWTPAFQVTGGQPETCTLRLYTVPAGPATWTDYTVSGDSNARCTFELPAMSPDEFHQYQVWLEFETGPTDPNLTFGADIQVIPPPQPPVIEPPVEEPDGETGIGVQPGDGQGLAVDVEVLPAGPTGSLAGTTAECTDRAVSPNLETGGSVPRLSTSCGLAPGQYSVNARMVDAAGSVTTSTRSITVLAPRPAIKARNPAPNQTGVARNIRPTVTFTIPVSGVSSSSFRLRDVATGAFVPATVTYDPTIRRATLRPSALLGAGRTYRLYLTSAIKNTSGRSMLSTAWSFKVTTDATRPTYTRSPGSGATGVSRTANVVLTFKEPVVGVSASRLRLRDAATGAYVSAVVTYDSNLRRAVLNPSATLRGLRRYTVVVSSGITDRAGNPLSPSPTTWSFTTRS